MYEPYRPLAPAPHAPSAALLRRARRLVAFWLGLSLAGLVALSLAAPAVTVCVA